MKTAGRIPFVLFFTLLAAALAFAEGGTLTREPIPEGHDLSWWTAQVSFSSEEKASIKIPGTTEEADVYVVETSGDPPIRFYATQEYPTRIFLDSNGDGELQAGEVYEPPEDFAYYYRENVEIPYAVRDAIKSIPVTITAYAGDDSSFVSVHCANAWYRGKISVADKEYEACLFFRFPVPDPDICNEAVILDTDRDGVFNPFLDQWMAADGIASFDHRLWVASTVFSGSTAEFTVEPYSGPVGRLAVTGQGVHRMHVWLTPDGIPGLPSGKASPVCLPSASQPEYEIPPGFCRVDEVWLLSEKYSPVLYYCDPPVSGEIQGATANLVAGGTASVAVGGPLTYKISSHPAGISSRDLGLDYGGCTNPAGFTFGAVVASGTWAGFSSPDRGPPYEVRTAAGRLIASGNFDYG